MAETYEIKWKNDLKTYMNIFKCFIMEGNVHDLQPVDCGRSDGRFDYVALDEAIAEMYSDEYCVVFYDHTKQSGKALEPIDDNLGEAETEDAPPFDEGWFNSFTFYRKTAFTDKGERIASPNVELFKEYYQKEYLDRVEASATKDMQGSGIIDIRRIYDVMNEFDERKKDPRFAQAKPFMFLMPGVSRYMTRSGNPTAKENAILMILFNATQIVRTSCRLVLFVDKANDLPTWFESENSNSAIKKLYLPTPDVKFRETFFRLEMLNIMEPILGDDKDDKIAKFAAYTENYSLRRLQQLKAFVQFSEAESGVPSYKNIENIDKTVLCFEIGQNKDPWREPELRDRVRAMAGKIAETIKGQDGAVLRVSKALKSAVTGVRGAKKNDRRPRGIFFFAGPTGVGKTELAKQMAECLFQKQDSMIRFDMSEFREEHSDARLFGAPPGYVGYEAGGELTKAVKQNPFSIILFDEIEKAAPRIWDKFLQILGDGRLTDGKGETVSFTQSVIVFTSNLGITADPVTSDIAQMQQKREIEVNKQSIKMIEERFAYGQSEQERKELVGTLKELYEVRARLKGLTCEVCGDYLFTECYKDLGADCAVDAFNQFVSDCVQARIEAYFENIGRREVLGRIGNKNILVFNFMSARTAVKIANSTMKKFVKYLKYEHESQLDLTISPAAEEFIRSEAQKTDVLNLGGRGIVDCVEPLLRDLVDDFLFDHEESGLSAVIDVRDGKLIIT